MHIENIIIFNYRNCRFLELKLSKENPNVFIGLNDSGKSTVLQAFDLLLGNKPKYSSYGEGSYKSDLSNSLISVEQLNASLESKGLPSFGFLDDSTLIIGKLVYGDDEVEKYTDLNLTTALKWSIECNPTNVLWIAKRYYNNRSQTYLISSEADQPLELWNATQSTINGYIKELPITKKDIENENGKGRFSNFEKIRAVYSNLNCSLKWVDYNFGKSDKDIFPSFSLFDWNTQVNFCKDINSIFLSLSVKNSDFLFYNKFLIVEGDTEQYLIPQLYELYTNRSLLADNIQLLNIQGKNKWNENKRIIDKVLGDFNKSEDQLIFLFDNDMSFEIGKGVITDNMIFVGEQDIEDSIDDEIWLNILNDYYQGILEFTLEEIKSLKESVVKGAKCQDYEKFYPILRKAIKSKCEKSNIEYDSVKRIPSKGAESAEFLLKFMDTWNAIPLKIKEAFDKLRV